MSRLLQQAIDLLREYCASRGDDDFVASVEEEIAALRRMLRSKKEKAMEYQVVVSDEATKLSEAVRGLIEQGWRPQGGIAVAGWMESQENYREGYTEHSTEVLFAQAMVRTQNELGGR